MDLPFNMTVMRAADARRAMKWGLMSQQLRDDEFGINHLLNTLKLIYEDH